MPDSLVSYRCDLLRQNLNKRGISPFLTLFSALFFQRVFRLTLTFGVHWRTVEPLNDRVTHRLMNELKRRALMVYRMIFNQTAYFGRGAIKEIPAVAK